MKCLRPLLLPLCALLLTIPPVSAASLTRTSAFTYDAASGLLTKEVIEPTDSALCLVTEHSYDGFGNRSAATTRNCAGSGGEAPAPSGDAVITARTSTTTWGPDGRFAVGATNALGHTESRSYDARFGSVASLTGPNNLTTTWSADGFGRKTLEIRADATRTQWSYSLCNGACPGNTQVSSAAYLIQVTPLGTDGNANGPWVKSYFDALGREIRRETQGFGAPGSAPTVVVLTEYDPHGRLWRTSRPPTPPATALGTTTTYHPPGRITRVEAPDDSGTVRATTTTYSGRTTTVTDPLGRQRTTVLNSQGQVVSVTDAAGFTLSSQYDPFGNLTRTVDPAGNATLLSFDVRGRKTTLQDPDLGTWSYRYNAAGELVGQLDARAQSTTLAYDGLGRLIQRTEPDLVSTWSWDACPRGVGKLCQAGADTGTTRSHGYDDKGRPASTTTALAGVPVQTETLDYDAHGRPATRQWSTGLTLAYSYTGLGQLKEVRNASANTLIWRVEARNAEGALTQSSAGNGVVTQSTYSPHTGRLSATQAGPGNAVQALGYQYDALGRLAYRTDATQALTEGFAYDALDRLTQATLNAPATGLQTTTYAYDVLGNLTCRSDVSACSGASPNYAYGAVVAGRTLPHAVASVAGTVDGVTNPGYQYDANGNLTAGAGRNIGYTSYNLPITLSRSGASLTWTYGPEHQRVRQVSSDGATTIFVHPDAANGLAYEKYTAPGGAVTHKHFVSAGGQSVAIVELTGTVWTTKYLHPDHLGSVSAITNAAGAVIERLAYEPFGKRRWANGTADPTGMVDGQATDRGFTNHQMLDGFDLVHMNGRLYDPSLGRFMGADSYVQAPYDLQSYNRYSYVLNNPLLFTDPTGFKPFWRKRWFTTVVAIVAAVYSGGAAAGWAASSMGYSSVAAATVGATATAGSALAVGAAAGGVGSFVSTAIMTGDLKEAARAGAFGAATGAAFSGLNYALTQEAWFDMSHTQFDHNSNPMLSGGQRVTKVLGEAGITGTATRLRGGSFMDGFKNALPMLALGETSQYMRQRMILDSMKDPRNAAGISVGWFGDGFKLGGGRVDPDGYAGISPLGGRQGGIGYFGLGWNGETLSAGGADLGASYNPGSFFDHVVEAFAGPHDYLNSWTYNGAGQYAVTGFMDTVASIGNALNVAVAVPFVAGATAQVYAPALLSRRR
ncbi:MAG: RHS repeat protein [Betaproteobacteria bacterium]|nr:RHS repeat protein [Betaproteobacteria bacterium]